MAFGEISGIIDERSTLAGDLSRQTGFGGLSPPKDYGGALGRDTQAADANLLLIMQENEEHGVYLHDMGPIDDEERANLIIDNDTNQVYDVRKESDLIKLDRKTSTSSGRMTVGVNLTD